LKAIAACEPPKTPFQHRFVDGLNLSGGEVDELKMVVSAMLLPPHPSSIQKTCAHERVVVEDSKRVGTGKPLADNGSGSSNGKALTRRPQNGGRASQAAEVCRVSDGPDAPSSSFATRTESAALVSTSIGGLYKHLNQSVGSKRVPGVDPINDGIDSSDSGDCDSGGNSSDSDADDDGGGARSYANEMSAVESDESDEDNEDVRAGGPVRIIEQFDTSTGKVLGRWPPAPAASRGLGLSSTSVRKVLRGCSAQIGPPRRVAIGRKVDAEDSESAQEAASGEEQQDEDEAAQPKWMVEQLNADTDEVLSRWPSISAADSGFGLSDNGVGHVLCGKEDHTRNEGAASDTAHGKTAALAPAANAASVMSVPPTTAAGETEASTTGVVNTAAARAVATQGACLCMGGTGQYDCHRAWFSARPMKERIFSCTAPSAALPPTTRGVATATPPTTEPTTEPSTEPLTEPSTEPAAKSVVGTPSAPPAEAEWTCSVCTLDNVYARAVCLLCGGPRPIVAMPTRNRPVMKRVATEALRVEDADEAPPPHVPKKRVRVLQELASHNSRGLQEDAGGIIGGNP